MLRPPTSKYQRPPQSGLWQWFALLVSFGWATLAAHGQATIEGVVTPLPPAKPLPAVSQRYQLSGEVAERKDVPVAVVYLEGNFGHATNPPPAVLGQKHFQFSTNLVVIQQGTRVEFPNFDDDYHNVFSYSKPKRFDLGRYRKDEKPAGVLFDKPGVVKLYCEIHEHMRATILVVDTPYFTLTDSTGKFTLTNLPPGDYVLKAWLDEKAIREQPVTLKAGETVKVEFMGK
jgi:plastocyanin